MDVIRDCVAYDQWQECYYMLYSGDTQNRRYKGRLAQKPDGTTYLEEYLDFVEGCKPVPYIPQQLKTIVSEESEPFFAGRKEAGEVADIIQRRVQLYLEEKK